MVWHVSDLESIRYWLELAPKDFNVYPDVENDAIHYPNPPHANSLGDISSDVD